MPTQSQYKKLESAFRWFTDMHGSLGSLSRNPSSEYEMLDSDSMLVSLTSSPADGYDISNKSFVFIIGKMGGMKQSQVGKKSCKRHLRRVSRFSDLQPN